MSSRYLIVINGGNQLLLTGEETSLSMTSLEVGGHKVYIAVSTERFVTARTLTGNEYTPAEDLLRYLNENQPDEKWAIIYTYDPQSLYQAALLQEHGMLPGEVTS